MIFSKITKNEQTSLFFLASLILLIIRLIAIPFIPFGNDEAYYWDWGRDIRLSYYDHPPGVSWIAYLGNSIFEDPRYSRILVPFFHFGGAVLQFIALSIIVKPNKISAGQATTLFLLTQIIPYSFVGGFLLLPDSGLLILLPALFLSITNVLKYPKHMRLVRKEQILIGILLGLSFNFKYHGLIIGGTGIIYALWNRRKNFFQDLSGWIVAGLSFMVVSYPVIYWNIANNFLSFKYQIEHGTGNLTFSFSLLLKLLIAEIVFLSPLVFLIIIKKFSNKKPLWNKAGNLALAMGMPLLLFIILLSPFKEILPHWVVPSFWVLVPILSTTVISKKGLTLTTYYSIGLVTALLYLAISTNFQTKVFRWVNNKPSGLGELTLWPYVTDHLKAIEFTHPRNFLADKGETESFETCPGGADKHYIASLRWYWVAQLAANLPDHPKVISLDSNYLSYYTFRDDLSDYTGCRVILVGQLKHFDENQIKQKLSIIKTDYFEPQYHSDRKMIILWGKLK